ncbi:uncharacterized protein J4E79_011647 [Alternaria viburni]|uniref:uncharacterized protein n=1 Tax=Alternaria viburni TaxID=566460 RepID=UPI0020C1BD88|nr:uncharacterized protein J4E79_011647 [Alternaria viburni]KAI4641876.1 hypothetical protein J4E79_011647 [Alternaria viburni]
MGDRLTLAHRLLRDHPTKAVELLMDYLKDANIKAETEQFIGQNPPQRNLETESDHLHEILPAPSHHRNSSAQQASGRHHMQRMRNSIQTPSASAGSNKSFASGLAAAGMEKITILTCDDDSADQVVIAMYGSGKHNLIGDDVAYGGRGLSANQYRLDESMLVPTPSGSARVTTAVDLTWRNPGRNKGKTKMGTFYVVPENLLESDVVLASDESMERQFPSGRYLRGFVSGDEFHQAVPPPAPMPPYQPQYQPPSPEIQRAFGRVGAIHELQRMRGSEPPAQAAPSAPVNHSQQGSAPIPITSQGNPSDELEIEGYWGRMPISMSVDISSSGEQFFQAFQCMAIDRKRGDNFDRQRVAMLLRADEEGPEEEAYRVSLDQGTLEKRWKMIVKWIRKNKNSEEPHLYATVEIADG